MLNAAYDSALGSNGWVSSPANASGLVLLTGSTITAL